jgi:predicted enzyme related to lactoylglutathione lyase
VGHREVVAARAAEFGGEVSQPPIDTPYGRMAVLRDPTGAGFSIIKPTQPASG